MEKFIIKSREADKNNNDNPGNSKKRSYDEFTTSSIAPEDDQLRDQASTSCVDNHAPPTKKRKYQFCKSWFNNLQLNAWLTKKDGVPVCKVCGIKLPSHKPALIRHSESKRHLEIMSQVKNTPTILKAFGSSSTEQQSVVRRAELKLAGLLASNNLPFTLIDTLTPLLSNIFPDSQIAKEIKLGRTKATALVKNVIAPELKENLTRKLKEPSGFYSIIMDETTDISTAKQCAFTIIYFDNDTDTVRTSFFDMKETISGTAEDLFKCLTTVLSEKSIPIENLVGFASDTTNSMVGAHDSIFSRLKEMNPSIACIKCSCHMMHLVASKACLKMPKSVEDLLRNVGANFNRSSMRIHKLQEIQRYFQVDIHGILTPATARWLSIKQCVDRVLEQYEVLESYFKLEVFEDPSRITEDILKAFNNKFTKIYLEFLSYILGLLTDFNRLFQSETPLPHKLEPAIEHLIQTVSMNYMKIGECKNKSISNIQYDNPHHFLP